MLRPFLIGTLLVFLLLQYIPGSAQVDCQSTKHPMHAGLTKDGPLAQWPWDILHQRIVLDLTLGNNIAGFCTIKATPRQVGLTQLSFHLTALAIDSVTTHFGPLTYTHMGDLVNVVLPQPFSPEDTLTINVHYNGDPVTDPSGFGGFYTSPALTYNLGVAFQNTPHSFGRAWFPCVDNFTERSSYDFEIKTNGGRGSWCNGTRTAITQLGGDTIVTHWSISEPIPSYLASVAAADYREVNGVFPSISGTNIPYLLVGAAGDTTAMKNSFLHLPNAFERFERWFGPYRWNKVGYVLTTQGAMEHSTSIHYPRSIANGTLAYENIMAHELAHQWFGDLITCERAEEMYINEGFAEYLSYLFLEEVYGHERYLNEVRTNHRQMVQQAHLLDQGWWSLANVPQQWTYGEHSYNKGADVLHTLRSYLGDSLFVAGMTSFLQYNAFRAVNSTMLRDHLTATTLMPMDDFFNDWIFQPGWAAFEVDSFSVSGSPTPEGGYPTQVNIRQKQRGPSAPYNNVPMTITCLDALGNEWTSPSPVLVGGMQCVVNVAPPFITKWVVLNTDERISQAVTYDRDTLISPGTTIYYQTDLRLTVVQTPQPCIVHLEEAWVAADDDTDAPFAYVVSPDRYWRISGAIPQTAQINARFSYDGRPNITAALDAGLMENAEGVVFNEDSLVLLYRPDPMWAWSRFPQQTLSVLGNPSDKIGRIDITGAKAGEYVLAWRKSAVGTRERDIAAGSWTISPNPAHGSTLLQFDGPVRNGTVQLVDGRGRVVSWQPVQGSSLHFDLDGISSGHYVLRHVDGAGTHTNIGKLVVR
jgi:hypothetical protein